MNIVRKIFRRLSGTRAKELAVENARLREQIDALKKEKSQFKRRVANAKRQGNSDAVMAIVVSQLGPKDTVIDCGANVGKVTEQLAATGAIVHAFEPDPHAFEILTRKFDSTSNVFLHRSAVGDRNGQVSFYRRAVLDDDPERSPADNSIVASHLYSRYKDVEKVDVQMIDLAEFLNDLLNKGATVPFVKIDVEGAELDILPAMLEQGLFDRIALTAVETHEFMIADRAADFSDLRAKISGRYPKSRVNLDWI
jgi:FkbM family methyltransferase